MLPSCHDAIFAFYSPRTLLRRYKGSVAGFQIGEKVTWVQISRGVLGDVLKSLIAEATAAASAPQAGKKLEGAPSPQTMSMLETNQCTREDVIGVVDADDVLEEVTLADQTVVNDLADLGQETLGEFVI